MLSFRTKLSEKRQAVLSYFTDFERQMREAYDRRFHADQATQSSLADKLEINRSTIHRRLTGRANMTMETQAEMAWALGYRLRTVWDELPLAAAETRPAENIGLVSGTTLAPPPTNSVVPNDEAVPTDERSPTITISEGVIVRAIPFDTILAAVRSTEIANNVAADAIGYVGKRAA
ncbi:MAG: hypothetical protein HYR63_14050 [Proteobacteria bacterium]|nr:hypothetical protein [Pseudomonadota bacterium]